MKKLNVVFFGTPDFSVPTLELLHHHPDINLLAIVTMPDRPAGRGQELKSPPVAEYAKQNKIQLYQVENINKEETILSQLEQKNVDFILVLAFAQFLGSRVLKMPKLGCFNIHTSILPKYRGAAPIQYALLNGDTSTGVSIQKMVKEMDAGDAEGWRKAVHLLKGASGNLGAKPLYRVCRAAELDVVLQEKSYHEHFAAITEEIERVSIFIHRCRKNA